MSAPDSVERVIPKLLIGGEWRSAAGDRTFPVLNPATDDLLADVPNCTSGEAAEAVQAAKAALPEWRSAAAVSRSTLLRRLLYLVIARSQWLAEIVSLEEGKPLDESLAEIAYGAGFLEWAAEEAKRVGGETLPHSDVSRRILVLREGVGVTASITPWNFPFAMITRKLGPALAAGCTQVIKPASETPLTAMALCALVQEAGFPPGTVNLVTGPAALIAETWFGDDTVRKVSFTGSTEVGRRLIKLSAQNIARLSLELGGHAPVIVFPDVNIEKVVKEAVRGKYRNSGQSCISPNRYYVHEAIYDEFVAAFTEASRVLVVGPCTDLGAQIGPLIDDSAVSKAIKHIEDAVARGGKVTTGGSTVAVGEGFKNRFLEPTVIADTSPESLVCQEETFAPVAPIVRFTDEKSVIGMANDTEYGLASYVFTNDLGRVLRVAEALEYGIVGVNDCLPSTPQAPFGGVKHSGFGREGGHFVMDEYTDLKYVSIRF